MQVNLGGFEDWWPRHSSPGELLIDSELVPCLFCRSWNVPGMSLMKWAFLSGFGTLLEIITKTGVLHMAGKPRLVQFSSTWIQFPLPNPSLLHESTKTTSYGLEMCWFLHCALKKKKKKDIISWCQEKQSSWPLGSSQEILYLKQPVLVKLNVCWMRILLYVPILGCFDYCFPQ